MRRHSLRYRLLALALIVMQGVAAAAASAAHRSVHFGHANTWSPEQSGNAAAHDESTCAFCHYGSLQSHAAPPSPALRLPPVLEWERPLASLRTAPVRPILQPLSRAPPSATA